MVPVYALIRAVRPWLSCYRLVVSPDANPGTPPNSPAVPARYRWANNPACNLYNHADLPLAPFRTDAW